MTKKFVQMIVPLVLMSMISCSHRQADLKPLTFPADMDQPFLSMKNIVGEGSQTPNGVIAGLLQKIKGPQNAFSLARPTAIAAYGENILFVVDADAGKVFKLESENGSLTGTESFGEGSLVSPNGIAIWDNIIYISDTKTGQIHRYNLDLEYLDSFTVPDLERPGQLRLNNSASELLIVDTKAHQILVIDKERNVMAKIQKTGWKAFLNAPLAIDFTPEGKLAVLDALTRRVEFFSSEYEHLGGFGGYDHVPGSFAKPGGLAVSRDGYIFVSDAAFGNIQIFDEQGSLLYFFGKNGTAAGEFLMPAALYFDANDNLYVMDQYNNRVQVFHYAAQGG